MRRCRGARRYVFNRGLALQKERYAKGLKHLTYVDLCAELKRWKDDAETSWLNEIPSQVLQQALKDLTRAYDAFFKGKSEYPKFKKKGKNESFRFPQGVHLDQPNGLIYLPKIGWMRYRASRFVPGEIGQVTVSYKDGKSFVSIQTEREVEQPIPPSATWVGLDLGVKRFATLSDGTVVEALDAFRTQEGKLARLQRSMTRKEKFSQNWKKAKARVSAQQARIARMRHDFLHKVSTTISKSHAVVIVENLNIVAMTASAAGTVENPGSNVAQKSGLNKAILDQGWGAFIRYLGYKLDWQGGWLVAVDPRNTSRTCPLCGHVDADNRRTQVRFACVACGFEEHADLVGAWNIERAGLARLACGDTSPVGAMAQEPAEAISPFH